VREVTHVVDRPLDVVAKPFQGRARLGIAAVIKTFGGEGKPDSQPRHFC
jgi:hypothetical protein